jgi:hypothetical protein
MRHAAWRLKIAAKMPIGHETRLRGLRRKAILPKKETFIKQHTGGLE